MEKEIKDGYKFCDKCGAVQQESPPSPVSNTGDYANPINQSTVQKAPYNKMCIIGLVISGISLLINFWGLVGIAGTIVSVYGLISCEQKNENGKSTCYIWYCHWCGFDFMGMYWTISFNDVIRLMLDSDELNKSGFNVNIWMISLSVSICSCI